MSLLRSLLPLLFVLSACATLTPPPSTSQAPWPSVRIAVFTDPHLLAPSLVDSEEGWQSVEAGSFQVFRDEPEILQTRVAALVADRPDLVLVTGDLTKDGEKASHELMAHLLHPLVDAGIPVLVIPGNHDVLNPQASAFTARGRVPTASVTRTEFAQIYQDFGYGRALERDPSSLGYLAEPVPGLRILALDTARYEDNAARGRQVTAGRLRPASWPWIDGVLKASGREGVPVAAMMHHGLVEKFPGMGGLFADYLVADRDEVQRRLAAGGVQLVFTGHFHTLSAAMAFPGGSPILDLEGGTLSQYPLGYRQVEVAGGRLRVTTATVDDLPSYADRPGVFRQTARRIALENTGALVKGRLRAYRVPAADAAKITSAFTQAFAAVTAGDPVRPEGWSWPPQGLGPMGSLAVSALGSLPEDLWNPFAPEDRALDLPFPLPPGESNR